MQYCPGKSLHPSFLFALLLLFSQCKSKPKESNAPRGNQPVIVDVLIAEKEPVSNIVEANGTVIAGEYVELRPEVSGRLTYLNLTEGKSIAKGTVIARVNDADLRAQILRSKVQLDLAQKTVEGTSNCWISTGSTRLIMMPL
jgi:membrane fusion protein, multidrug efflux system